jgi:hypothetical protein
MRNQLKIARDLKPQGLGVPLHLCTGCTRSAGDQSGSFSRVDQVFDHA